MKKVKVYSSQFNYQYGTSIHFPYSIASLFVYAKQNKEIEAITTRWQADSMSDSWLSKNVRPLVLVWCICIFSLAGILDSVDTIPFNIGATWNDTFEKVMMAVVLAYFGGRTTEKATSLFKGK